MNVCIIGLGLIGGSLARAIRAYTGETIYAYDRDEDTLCAARDEGVIDGVCDEAALCACDLLLLCTYPEAVCAFLQENAPLIPRTCTVVDTCGTKRAVCRTGFALAAEYGFAFLGGHPMAGTQFSGYSASRETLFRAASMILCPAPETDADVLEWLGEFFLSLGFSRIQLTSPEEHDRMIAFTSQLAHVVSNAYIKSPMALAHRGFSAGSFRDLTRVAMLNPDMWTELFLQNADFLAEEIDTIIEHLKVYRDALALGDRTALHDALAEGSERKKRSEEQ